MEIGGSPDLEDGHYEHGSRSMPVVVSCLGPCESSQLASHQSAPRNVGRKYEALDGLTSDIWEFYQSSVMDQLDTQRRGQTIHDTFEGRHCTSKTNKGPPITS